MTNREKILAIIDPTQDIQPALERAIANANMRKSGENSHLILLIAPIPTASDKENKNYTVYQTLERINELQQSVENEGLSNECLISWSAEWATSALNIANEHQADMVMLPFDPDAGQGWLISDDKWALLRKCESPILMVRPGQQQKRQSILVSLKLQDESYADLNRRVLERGAWAADRYGAELHVVNAYSDSLAYPDRSKIANVVDIDNRNIHLQHGDPEKAIADIANKVDADMILIGTKRRSGIKAALRGNTIEKITGSVSQDIMLMI